VKTRQDSFAAAALPPPDGEPSEVIPDPHEVLGLAPDADPVVVKAAARQLSKKYHPDTGDEPDRQAFTRVQKAKDDMLEDMVE